MKASGTADLDKQCRSVCADPDFMGFDVQSVAAASSLRKAVAGTEYADQAPMRAYSTDLKASKEHSHGHLR
jgi:hypothetical protein